LVPVKRPRFEKGYIMKKKKSTVPKLEKVRGGDYLCKYSVLEDKMAILSRNQEKIYALLLKRRGKK